MRSDHPRRGGTVQVVRGTMLVTCPGCQQALRVGTTTVAYVEAKERPSLELSPDPQDYSSEEEFLRRQDYYLGQLEMNLVAEPSAPPSAHLFPQPTVGRLILRRMYHQIRRLSALVFAGARWSRRILRPAR